MAEIKEFVVNDRRKFTSEGDLRPDAPTSEPKAPRPEAIEMKAVEPKTSQTETHGPQAVPDRVPEEIAPGAEQELPPAPTEEQTGQAKAAYDATVDRLDTAIRAGNPGAQHMPPMTFDRFIQSLYMQAILQLGGAAEPGTTPQVDLLGARQSIDMIAVIAEKVKGNLAPDEDSLIQSALFEARMGFLEVTQMLSRQAAAKHNSATPSGPSIVR
jgi:hypothetical protein